MVFCEFSPQIKEGDVFVSESLFDSEIDPFYYPETVRRRSNILYTTNISAEDEFDIISHREGFTDTLDKYSRLVGYRLDRLFSRDSANLAKALLLGDKHELSGVLSRDFGRAGISHLLALSGMHLALMTGFIIGSLKPFIKSKRVRFILTALLAAFIMIFTGGSSSIVRASLMLIHYQAGNLLRDRADILTSLFAVTAGILVIDPYSVFDVGLILSFSATLGIALTLEFAFTLSSRLFGAPVDTGIVKAFLRACFQSLCISFFAGLFANIASFFFFERISLLSTLTTVLFTPLIAVFMLLCAVALILSASGLSALPTAMAEILYSLTERLCSYISELDNIMISTRNPVLMLFTVIFTAFFVFCTVKDIKLSYFAAGSLCLRLALLSGFAVYTFLLSFDTQLHIIARENESGFFISNRHSSAYIDISYGSSGINTDVNVGICEHLDTELDYYILSHYHFDHINAIRKFNEYTLVRKLLLPIPQNDTDTLYAEMLTEAADRLNIAYEFFESEKDIDLCGISFSSLALERKNKSSHPYITLLFKCPGQNIVYSSGVDERSDSHEAFKSVLNDADTVITSTHPAPARGLLELISESARLITFDEAYIPGESENDIHLPYCICALSR